jgi:putative ABC transport system substrate-binding protein
MRRRDFIKGMAGSAVATWPLAAYAQQADRMRYIGVLMHSPSNEPEAQARLAAFLQGMRDAGWEVGRNLRIEYRWSVGDTARLSRDAKELVALNPDVILAGVGATCRPCYKPPAPFRLYSHKVSIRSVTDMSIV